MINFAALTTGVLSIGETKAGILISEHIVAGSTTVPPYFDAQKGLLIQLPWLYPGGFRTPRASQPSGSKTRDDAYAHDNTSASAAHHSSRWSASLGRVMERDIRPKSPRSAPRSCHHWRRR